MVFFLEITNIWQKFRDFWFADFFPEIFLNPQAGMVLVVLNVFDKFITNLKFSK
jgi:hypothetical protein